MVANSVSWNPMEAANFVIASEDTNVYSFDMRKMDKPKVVHEDHLNAVMSVDFSPTGEEFVSGSYDKTVRIFKVNQYKSREVYFNKRMQRVFAAKFSLDGRFVFSGSDDTNIRVWKAVASEKMGILSKSESKSMDYCDKIKAKFRHMPQIKRISRHRQLPKSIYNAQKLKRTIKNAKKVRIQKYEERTKKPFPHRKNKKGVFAVID
ncbi:hypothetical protein MHBO_004615 [Bonamia ostreae]|uniref:Sof1-like protein domain-containing protein n=1 Tax=Bonamia ostreae TaxID=126728 RepID=A0ABV2AUL7_9EUKA